MPPNRPKLILDEQAFQDLLSAAFTIQEHNARLNQVRQTEIRTPLRSQAEPDNFCNRCGAPKPAEESRCPHCGLDEFRPGERMQRKWASMWLMSQEQSLWPERPAAGRGTLKEVREDPQETHTDSRETGLRSEAERQRLLGSPRDSAADSVLADLATGKAKKTEATAKNEAATVQQHLRGPSVGNASGGNASGGNKGARENTALPIESIWGTNSPTESARGVWAPENPDLATQTLSLQASDDFHKTGAAGHGRTATERIATDGTVFDGTVFDATMSDETLVDEALFDETTGETKTVDAGMADNGLADGGMVDAESDAYPSPDFASTSPSLGRRLADLRLTLRFHRANLYLGAAIFVAALALMWPTVSSPHRDELSPVERALIAIGVAEAPAPVIRSTGDPGINVWVDPHTALYYCPGEEQYGRTPDGRVSSQRDAQMDRFQPAGRAPCE
jgi:hypothetical protein